ncbi:MAG: phage portal protein [Sedimentisphaerales bacterium]|nr:phage portal protein [Sedimentisphaerales bacterium]
MGFETGIFQNTEIQSDFIDWLVDSQWPQLNVHFEKLWNYYANPAIQISDSRLIENGHRYIQAQEIGLPSRITGYTHTGSLGTRQLSDVQRKEIVIENDIAWRVNAIVDFLFGKPVSIISKSPNGGKSAEVEMLLKALFSANGAIGFFQDMAVLGSVYGFVDCFVRPGEQILSNATSPLYTKRSMDTRDRGTIEDAIRLVQTIALELIEAPRALPVLDENDYKKINYYVQNFYQKKNTIASKGSFLSRILSSGKRADDRQTVCVTEITSADAWQRYEDKELVAEGRLPWGFLPVVHIQNIAQPYYYEGHSDVEPLIPLQDELNTRLSDRASRITFQSFKMYLGKGIEGFENKPVSPGRMWYTDNPDASIEQFGGDEATPSEGLHIAEIREAMDKVSSVTPMVAGVLKDRLGNLTSAVALRLTLMGMLSKNERKRFTYSEGIKQISKIVLSMLDMAGIYKTQPEDRHVDVIFPSPLPENTMEKLEEAKLKKELGVSTEQLLRELGYES